MSVSIFRKVGQGLRSKCLITSNLENTRYCYHGFL